MVLLAEVRDDGVTSCEVALFEKRRAIDARARQIVAESDALWAEARDLARIELSIEPNQARSIARGLDDPWSLLWIPAVLAGQALIVAPLWFVVGVWVGLSCGTTVNQPCDDLASNALTIWTGLLMVLFVASAFLAFFRRLIWLVLPLPTAALTGVCLVVVWELLRG